MSDGAEEYNVTKSVRFSIEQWARVEEASKAFRMEPAVMMRRLVMKSLKDLSAEIQKRLTSDSGELF